MEYSLARSLENSLEISTVPFPHLSSDPAIDQVNPGIGHLVSLYETVVPMQGHSLHAIEKKVEERENVAISRYNFLKSFRYNFIF